MSQYNISEFNVNLLAVKYKNHSTTVKVNVGAISISNTQSCTPRGKDSGFNISAA